MTVTHLGALIEQQQRLNGYSYSDMVARAAQRGERLGKSNIGRVAAGDNPSLSRATIFGLAAGLGVTPATVARAVLADMGIIITEQDADTETAIRTDPTLPEGGRRLLLAMLAEIKSTEIRLQDKLARSQPGDWEFVAGQDANSHPDGSGTHT